MYGMKYRKESENMNNNYNCVEGCNIPSSPNDMKILLKNIKAEVDELVKTTEAKLLCHDGKIAELCKYLKDNLSNSIRCLLDSMQLSGELDEIINDSILNEFRNLKNDSINVKDFGAIGNDEFDNTIAFTKAFNLANELKKNINLDIDTTVEDILLYFNLKNRD